MSDQKGQSGSEQTRVSQLEAELNDAALLYLAASQLHARREPKQVLGDIGELLEQLVGVEEFVLYLVSRPGEAQPAFARGFELAQLTPVRTSEPPWQSAFARTAPSLIAQSPLPHGSLAAPLAVVPLRLGEHSCGAIAITKLFDHKPSWAAVDRKLFELLSNQAAAALIAAHLHPQHDQLLGTLKSLGERLK